MAPNERKQGEWPAVKRQPVADFLTPDGFRRTDRAVAGPLRLGTAPGVGPSGFLSDGPSSDMGMDRTSPRDTDVMGTARNRSGEIRSERLSRQIRGRDKPED